MRKEKQAYRKQADRCSMQIRIPDPSLAETTAALTNRQSSVTGERDSKIPVKKRRFLKADLEVKSRISVTRDSLSGCLKGCLKGCFCDGRGCFSGSTWDISEGR
ncbi:hypothetical protein CDAR_113891 [Caerostris darwini]|uniref:Uncharacterized protein n=1 Tax=Caerostris darwini TaxID=1538125 RepID=A0AAV4SQD8_9ARAC|nr:hypothetical protein CDAR_113891 [Caerostris darwini]